VTYWQGLAEYTALRIREFGRLQGLKKAQARYYKLVVILDDRTSDFCRALAAQDKIYPLNDAIEVIDNLMALDTKSSSLDDARDYIKALAPWVKDIKSNMTQKLIRFVSLVLILPSHLFIGSVGLAMPTQHKYEPGLIIRARS